MKAKFNYVVFLGRSNLGRPLHTSTIPESSGFHGLRAIFWSQSHLCTLISQHPHVQQSAILPAQFEVEFKQISVILIAQLALHLHP